MELPGTPNTSERPKRKCSAQPTVSNTTSESSENVASGSSSSSLSLPKKSNQMKKSTPLRVLVPAEEDCKLSDDLADCVS